MTPAATKKKILFICIGNAIRSQMAEAFARHYASDLLEPLSAGLSPMGRIPPLTLQVMEEKGVSLEGQRSKSLYDVPLQNFDHIVNISGEPLLGPLERMAVKWDVKDPIGKPVGDYRAARDKIDGLVQALVAELRASS